MYIHFVSLHVFTFTFLAKSLTLRYFLEEQHRGCASQKQVFDMEKETNIIIRIKPNDKEEIKKKASSAGLTVSEYARKLLLTGEIIKVDPEDRLTLNGIANNLNQLTRLANQMKAIQPETENVLRNLIKQIRHAYRKR
jgi:predicted DNA binding CopG/RHH family protein